MTFAAAAFVLGTLFGVIAQRHWQSRARRVDSDTILVAPFPGGRVRVEIAKVGHGYVFGADDAATLGTNMCAVAAVAKRRLNEGSP